MEFLRIKERGHASSVIAGDFSKKRKRRFYRYGDYRQKAGLKKTGFCGGWERKGKLRFYSSKYYLKRVVIARFAPDADGYRGIYKLGNRILKRKMLRERLSSPSLHRTIN